MASKSEGEAALGGLNGKVLKERTIVVNEARPRSDDSGRGSYGNRRGDRFGRGGRQRRY